MRLKLLPSTYLAIGHLNQERLDQTNLFNTVPSLVFIELWWVSETTFGVDFVLLCEIVQGKAFKVGWRVFFGDNPPSPYG